MRLSLKRWKTGLGKRGKKKKASRQTVWNHGFISVACVEYLLKMYDEEISGYKWAQREVCFPRRKVSEILIENVVLTSLMFMKKKKEWYIVHEKFF